MQKVEADTLIKRWLPEQVCSRLLLLSPKHNTHPALDELDISSGQQNISKVSEERGGLKKNCMCALVCTVSRHPLLISLLQNQAITMAG